VEKALQALQTEVVRPTVFAGDHPQRPPGGRQH
jgi:hypothetical protein